MIDDAAIDLDSDGFELPAEPEPVAVEAVGPAAAPSPPAEPVVVIQYRSRGLPAVVVFPISLLASLGLFAGYHHLYVEPIDARAQALAPRPATIVEEIPPIPAATIIDPPAIPTPLTLESQPLPSGFTLPPALNTPPQAVATTPSLSPPSDPPAPASTPPEPPTPAVALEPETPPPISIATAAVERAKTPPPADPEALEPDPAVEPAPTREQLMERLKQEGLLKQAREEEMERRKLEAGQEVQAEALQRVEDERLEFRQALQEIVSTGKDDAGEAIDDLCNRFGRGYTDELKNRAYGSLAHYKGKLSRDGEVQMLRAIGVPEPGILDYLANRLHRSMRSRNGPRHPGEVRLFAARQLLRIKVDPSLTPAPASPPVERRPASVRRTNHGRRP